MVRLEALSKLKKIIHLIGIRTRDLWNNVKSTLLLQLPVRNYCQCCCYFYCYYHRNITAITNNNTTTTITTISLVLQCYVKSCPLVLIGIPPREQICLCTVCEAKPERHCLRAVHRPCGRSSWLQIQRSGFDSRRYQIL
jgi:hypothetical protein